MKPFTLLIASGILLSFSACQNKAPKNTAAETETPALSETETQAYRQKGSEIAQATFTALSGQLKQAMQEGGVAHAAQYCNLVAYPLVDSLSQVHQAEIRRTSLKIRNPQDEPTEAERAMLEEYHTRAEAGEELASVVQPLDEQTVAFYAPIKIQALCLTCHGTPGETLTEDNYAVIKELYPQDEAIGYNDGDLRGMWSIKFKR